MNILLGKRKVNIVGEFDVSKYRFQNIAQQSAPVSEYTLNFTATHLLQQERYGNKYRNLVINIRFMNWILFLVKTNFHERFFPLLSLGWNNMVLHPMNIFRHFIYWYFVLGSWVFAEARRVESVQAPAASQKGLARMHLQSCF